jgi:hypothetical protein
MLFGRDFYRWNMHLKMHNKLMKNNENRNCIFMVESYLNIFGEDYTDKNNAKKDIHNNLHAFL